MRFYGYSNLFLLLAVNRLDSLMLLILFQRFSAYLLYILSIYISTRARVLLFNHSIIHSLLKNLLTYLLTYCIF